MCKKSDKRKEKKRLTEIIIEKKLSTKPPRTTSTGANRGKNKDETK
ncbi:MAG: hypothetical protein KAI43_07820 [Candidatus Aureabacteria bacterium]|nr:hypothetical protein [Candidatus Auribacterota bacterium]